MREECSRVDETELVEHAAKSEGIGVWDVVSRGKVGALGISDVVAMRLWQARGNPMRVPARGGGRVIAGERLRWGLGVMGRGRWRVVCRNLVQGRRRREEANCCRGSVWETMHLSRKEAMRLHAYVVAGWIPLSRARMT